MKLIIPFFKLSISHQFIAITVWMILLLANNFSPETQVCFSERTVCHTADNMIDR